MNQRKRLRLRPGPLAAVLFSVVLVCTSCAAPPPAAPPIPVGVAGNAPSASAVMVCAPEAQRDIAGLLGINTTVVSPPTWRDHIYSCRYVYTNGSFVLSVKELSSPDETTAYVNSLGMALGRRSPDIPLGDGAFQTRNGSMVMRKDNKVLYVNTNEIPATFGIPSVPHDSVAQFVTAAIAGCWTGS
jgi:hypothetical protein